MSLRAAGIWGIVVLVCALSLSALLPMHSAIPGSVVPALVGFLLLRRQSAHACAEVAERLESVPGSRWARQRAGVWGDPGAQLARTARHLAAELEDSYFKLVRTNIQLLALKEVGSHIISSLDRKRTLDAVLQYLKGGIGFVEYGLFTWSPETGVFSGGLSRRRGDGFEWVEESFALAEAGGVLGRSLARQRSCLIRDVRSHELGSLHGESLFPHSAFESFAVVPLLKTAAVGPIWQRKGCAPERCPLSPDTEVEDWADKFANEPDPDYWQGGRFRCWSCAGFPILGCLLVTDTGRELPLSRVDLVVLETLGQNLAAVLENARLYEELQQEERFRDHVIGGMSNGLLSVDLDGCITLLNQAGERLSGYAGAEIRGRRSHALVLQGAGRDPLREALETGRSAHGVEAVLRTADGRDLPIQLTTSLLRDEGGRVHGAIAEFADLSAIKGMQAQIRNLDKLAALGRFTSSVAHEIRNPLAGITAGIQYMTRHMKGEKAAHAEFVLAEVDRLNRIINDLFAAGRPLELTLRDTAVESLVERSVRALEPSFDKHGVRCVRRAQPQLPEVALDGGRIEQVLINLIQNAVEASPRGGVVEIDLWTATADVPQVRRGDGDSLVISVRDHGVGIPEEERDKIFEPFFTSKAHGTGLGLYISHHIVECHGGRIVVESRPGEGSCFLLCLPLGRILMGGASETADLARR